MGLSRIIQSNPRKQVSYTVICILLIGMLSLILFKHHQSLARTEEHNLSVQDDFTSLVTRLNHSKPDTNQVAYLLKIADHFISREKNKAENLSKAWSYLEKAQHLNAKLQSPNSEFRILMTRAKFFDKENKKPQQAAAYEMAIKLAKKIGNRHFEASAWYFYYVNIPDTVTDYRNKTFYTRAATAHALYKQIGSSFDEKYREASLLKSMADFHLEEEKFDLAIAELHEVIALDKRHKLPDLPMAYDLLSAVYQRKGELSKALNAALLSVKIAQNNHEEVLGTYLNRVGAAYEAIGKPVESIAWYSKTLNAADKTNPYRSISAYMLSTQMIKLGKADQALALLNKTWREIPDKDGFEYFMFLGYGECYTSLKNYKLADRYFKILLSGIDKDAYSNPFLTSIYFSVSEFYFSQNNYKLALTYAEKARKNQISMTLPRQIRLNEILYKIRMATKQPAEAITNFQDYHRLRDSMLSQENLSNIERLQVEFQASQKESENEILRKKSQLQSQELNRIQLIKNFTFGGLIFLSIVLLLLYGRFRLKQKLHQTLAKKKADIDLAYAKLEVNIQQKNKLIGEKESLIKEVHHRVKNNLQLTMSLLNSQSYYLEDLAAIEAIKESQHRLKSIALIHQKLYQNETMASITIQPYMVELVDYLKESLSNGKHLTFELNILNLELDISRAVPLGLIINEAITNIFKYAFPDRKHGKIEISLQEYPGDQYCLLIKDNGIGLPPDFDYEQSNTLGLTLMKGLSRQIDGLFAMESMNGVSVSLIFANTPEDLSLIND